MTDEMFRGLCVVSVLLIFASPAIISALKDK